MNDPVARKELSGGTRMPAPGPFSLRPSGEPVGMVWGLEMELQMHRIGRDRRVGWWNGAQLLLDFHPQETGPPRSFWAAHADTREWHRTANGARYYYESPDLPEVSTAECRRVLDLVANTRAQLHLVSRRLRQVNRELEGATLEARLAATDQAGHSFGQHHNFRLPQPLIDDWLDRRPHYLQRALIPHLASGVILWGAGKAGSENGTAEAPWQLSQRADFLEQPGISFQTISRRGFVADRRDLPERLMLICFDGARLERALALAMGTTGLVLALMAAEEPLPDLILRDPVGALQAASRDLSLQAPVLALENGQRRSALELQETLCERCRAFVESERTGPVVMEEASFILDLWEETLHHLRHDRAVLAEGLDWVAKWALLEDLEIPPDSAEAQRFDLEFARLDENGPVARLQAAGAWESLASEEQVAGLVRHAPRDTRAWLRAAAVQKFGAEIAVPDWDQLRSRSGWEVDLSDATGFTAADVAGAVERADTAEELLRDLGGTPPRWSRAWPMHRGPVAATPRLEGFGGT